MPSYTYHIPWCGTYICITHVCMKCIDIPNMMYNMCMFDMHGCALERLPTPPTASGDTAFLACERERERDVGVGRGKSVSASVCAHTHAANTYVRNHTHTGTHTHTHTHTHTLYICIIYISYAHDIYRHTRMYTHINSAP